jgi:hypothetical protein
MGISHPVQIFIQWRKTMYLIEHTEIISIWHDYQQAYLVRTAHKQKAWKILAKKLLHLENGCEARLVKINC